MNYRHAFHAGNFADVFKHIVLTRILLYLARKAAPFRVIDTHAGSGRYALGDDMASRTGEWRDGIGKLDAAALPAETRALLEPYLDCVGTAGSGQGLYPGSPAIAQALTRPFDRIALCELHPPTLATLRGAMGRDKRVKIVEIDGYTGLKAFVPPIEKRGLVLLDPPFESVDEFARLAEAVAGAYAKWRTGIVAAWFPLKSRRGVEGLLSAVRETGARDVLLLEFGVAAPGADGPLVANGMVVVNPPYVLADEMRQILPTLTRQLAAGDGAFWRVDDKVAQAR